MLSRADALNIPDIQAEKDQQARIQALGITINQFQKTLQGRALIEREERFVLNGALYQGFNQKALEVTEDLCTDEEIEAAQDVDGTKFRIMDTRRRRLEGAAGAKDREQRDRKKAKIAQERDELELILLKRKISELPPEEPESDPLAEPEVDPESATGVLACTTCGKAFPSFRALNAHKMGAKHG